MSAAGLFLLAPFVGEFLLGNQPITALPWLLALAPMYGGGALLIREAARRLGGGWPMIITLAAAYALTEEGPIDQMIFNPGYLGLPDFDGFAPIPGLGISATLVQGALTLHTVWSISVPVAIMEAFAEDQQRPWLGRAGLIVVAVIFVLGSLVLAFLQWDRFHFIAEPLPLAVTGVVIMIMIVVAVRCARRPRRTPTPTGRERTPPRPRTVGLTAFALSGLYWIADLTDVGSINPWVELGCWIAYAVGCAVLLTRVARRPGWDRSIGWRPPAGCCAPTSGPASGTPRRWAPRCSWSPPAVRSAGRQPS